jgi:hypothetical protein
MLEKTGGDSLGEVRDNLAGFRARAAAATASAPGAEPEAGSGGDD